MTFLGAFVALFLGPVGLMFVSFRAFFASLIVPVAMLTIVLLAANPEGIVNETFLNFLQVASAMIFVFGLPTMAVYNFICAIACLWIGLSRKPQSYKSYGVTPSPEMKVFDDIPQTFQINKAAKTINEMYSIN